MAQPTGASAEVDADTRITIHEAICAERYGALLSMIGGMATRVGRLEMLVWISAGTLICGMATILVDLVLKRPVLH
jgi:hypothetical protein